MKQLVSDFTKHLKESLEIGKPAPFIKAKSAISNVLISGLGGSGIGGTIASQIIAAEIKVPVTINKDYFIPAFVGENTLFIACSYSGNTEETLSALEKAEEAGAEIACITSGGKLLDIAKEKRYNYTQIPSGFPPRAAFGFAFPQLFFILGTYGLISNKYEKIFETTIKNLNAGAQNIQAEAKAIAQKLLNKIPVIYAVADFEGVCVRFRQQINENSKMLCWHHVIPEMNHNELVGWRKKDETLAVVIFRNDTDYYRTKKRIEINREIIEGYCDNITEIHSKGNSMLERSLYLIHLGDWISVYLADLQQIDPVEVDVITGLKNKLAEI